LQVGVSENKSRFGIKICPTTDKTPLLFAGDCLLFCKSNFETCRKLNDLLDAFCCQSGQLMNFHKSALVYSRNATSSDKSTATVVFNGPHRDSLGKYLECPLEYVF